MFVEFDLSENANLKFLSLTTRRELYEVEGPFAKYIPGLLSRVTSDHISCIDLDLDCLTGEILRESFSRLNSVLSRPVFNNLRNIHISLFRIRGLRGHGRIEKQDADLVEQLWLSFDKRDILGCVSYMSILIEIASMNYPSGSTFTPIGTSAPNILNTTRNKYLLSELVCSGITRKTPGNVMISSEAKTAVLLSSRRLPVLLRVACILAILQTPTARTMLNRRDRSTPVLLH